MKKFYIKKSPSDLIQEQNRLLEILLDKQNDKPKLVSSFGLVASDYITTSSSEALEFHYEDDDIPYIPTSSISGSAKLHSVDVEKKIFDEDNNVEKLKQARVNAKLD